MSDSEFLKIEHARENNLKDLSLELPHDVITVVTGLSGSGKSSLAFHTVFAEGQRRYIETFSPYTRQFFDKVKKPDADALHNVRPAIAIRQRTRILNSRSTVGSMTDINDYLKVLWSNLAEPRCPVCDECFKLWEALPLCEHLRKLSLLKPKTTYLICAEGILPDTARAVKGEITRLILLGYNRFYNQDSGDISELDAVPVSSFKPGRKLYLLLDRFRSDSFDQERMRDAVQQAFAFGSRCVAVIETLDQSSTRRPYLRIQNNPAHENVRTAGGEIALYESRPSCPHANLEVQRPKPSLFSFNHPVGACEECKGFGKVLAIDINRCVPNPQLSIDEKAIACWASPSRRREFRRLLTFCEKRDISTNTPWAKLPASDREAILHNRSREYLGVYDWFKHLEYKSYKMHVRVFLSRYRGQFDCPVCLGMRLKPAALAYQIDGKRLPDLWLMPIKEIFDWLETLQKKLLKENRLPREIGDVFNAALSRLHFLIDLGLPYLTLDRQARTLSGGETQRVNLATALGSELVSTQFVLDEPSVGLHARDTERLIGSIRTLKERGNSVLIVEHDLDCINEADHIVELGPKAGAEGGEVVYAGSADNWSGIQIDADLSETEQKEILGRGKIQILKASARNLKGFDLSLPLNSFVVLTGVSGSGKSTLVQAIIQCAYEDFKIDSPPESDLNLVRGFEKLDDVLIVDQSALAKSPRSNIATYTKMWDDVRRLLSETEQAKLQGLGKAAFSFNVDGGRCPACSGSGFIKEDMQFLSDVYVPCELCLGRRFQDNVLQVTLRGKNVDELLQTTVSDAKELFHDFATIHNPCATLCALGLGHLRIGHPLSELSGGEAQRLKLVPFIQEGENKSALLIFDEPTTGLHAYDVRKLIALFHLLVERGHSVLCIEHNLPLILSAEWIVDLGPEGGADGGSLILEGTPSEFLESENTSSHTARYLKDFYKSAGKKSSKTKPAAPVPSARSRDLLLRGAREHNLKNVSLDIPLNMIVCLTGVSGSGKSTIAKDILYAEGQRRYLDCLSPYARQFIRELKKPELDSIHNVQPSICVYQHTFQPSQLSTIGTMSEVYNFLRLLLTKAGTQYCPDHPDQAISFTSSDSITDEICDLNNDSVRVLAPIVKLKKGHHRAILERAQELEINELRIDDVLILARKVEGPLERTKVHSIDFVIARFNPKKMDRELVRQAVDQAITLGGGTIIVLCDDDERVYSTDRTCPVCKQGFFKPDPEDLSFNSRRGVCRTCMGKGHDSAGRNCKECGGARINELGRNIRFGGLNVFELSTKTAPELSQFLASSPVSDSKRTIADAILRELHSKLETLSGLGLDYLPLTRDCATLSNGELQRLRLATAMGSPLSGAMYIFDEPSAGLHPKDNQRVLEKIGGLKDRHNSVLIIEHDPLTILQSEHIIDVGPEGGSRGGEIVYAGPIAGLFDEDRSLTARALRNDQPKDFPKKVKRDVDHTLTIRNASKNNIAKLTTTIPLQAVVTVCGVSGAGKSSFVHGIVGDTVLNGRKKAGARHVWALDENEVESSIPIDRMVWVDQQPIGANSRSTPASYLGIWDEVRKVFAGTLEAKTRGWTSSFFSYNSGKGRCTECQGRGTIKLEMSFLPDAQVLCDRCNGSRFGEEANSVRYLDRTVSDILALTFDEARVLFANHRKIHHILHQACEMGLGYLTLGQSSTTLSGGESQRIKLVSELSTRRKGHTVYVLDEPTTGLHKADVSRLVKILRELVAMGNSVLLIEHDEDVILGSDYVFEFGPGPGAQGGKIVFKGLPQKLKAAKSPWGEILRNTNQEALIQAIRSKKLSAATSD